MTADLTPAQAARLEAIEAAPYAEEAAVERVARALWAFDAAEFSWNDWEDGPEWAHNLERRRAVAAIDVMRGATDDGAAGRVHCSTCECIHEPCGYVIGSAGCEDFHDRAAVGAPATAEGDGA